MIRHIPPRFVSDGTDGESNRSVDQSDPCASALAAALLAQIDQSLRDGRTWPIGAAAIHDLQLRSNFGLRTAPFLKNVSSKKRRSFQAKQGGRLPLILD